MNKKAFIPLGVFVALCVLFALPILRGKDPSVVPTALSGRVAPSSHFREFSTRDFKGHVTVVNFFASWCAPCRAEQPMLEDLAHMGGVNLYGVAYKDKRDNIAEFLKKEGNPFRAVGYDGDGHIALDWGVYGVPETFILDKSAIIRYRHTGPLTEDVLQKEIRPLIRELQQ